jgi:threonine/homoserine/homoserine lactone efflux protein
MLLLVVFIIADLFITILIFLLEKVILGLVGRPRNLRLIDSYQGSVGPFLIEVVHT